MKNSFLRRLAQVGVVSVLAVASSCNLDRQPFNQESAATVYTNFANYNNVLAKLYAGLATTGQKQSDDPDLKGFSDVGFTQYMRQYWQAQELSTDEAVIAWNDGSLPTMHLMTWDSNNEFLRMIYNRIYYQVGLCNEFIRQTTDSKMSSNNIASEDQKTARQYRAEARFLRALSYYHALDLFGNVPFVSENDEVGAFLPKRMSRPELYNYIVSELEAISGPSGELLTKAGAANYGRADKASAQTLLAKLYLNAEVYTGQGITGTNNPYTKCIENCIKVIGSGYSLTGSYTNLFRADNNTSQEIIFPVVADGLEVRGYGNTTYLVHASIGGRRMVPANYGVNGGWSGLRTTKALINLFPDTTQRCPDKRFQFYTWGQRLEILGTPASNGIDNFNNGFAVTKFRNVTSTNGAPKDPAKEFSDVDFPMFRLGDVYLMYAEAVERGGTGGNRASALGYLNALRVRAYGNTSANITSYDLPYILAERGRELYWEATRRTDLVRFKKFTRDYNWPWKGNVQNGQDVSDFRNLYPIPSTELVANPNITQNQGYN